MQKLHSTSVTMERGNLRSSRGSKELMDEEQNEFISSVKSLQINVSSVSTQILVGHWVHRFS
jgi:hypothetical protein